MTLTDAQIVRLTSRGVTIAQLAIELNEPYTTIQRAALAAGISIPRRRLQAADELIAMKADGVANADIARRYSVSPSAVTEALKRAREASVATAR